MGFKRTSEGRVFFQDDGDEGANDEYALLQKGQPQKTQLQILTLLKSLNERLKITQAERNKMRRQLETYRFLIEDLAGKADQQEEISQTAETRAVRAEKIAAETLKELEKTRKLIADVESRTVRADKGIESLKKLQREQVEKLAGGAAGYAKLTKRLQNAEIKQEDLGKKVEEAIGGQARLTRKIDKAVEDRARFMRKIERIEEAVVQTRDSLSAKAMVLLTDQGVSQTTIESAGSFASGDSSQDVQVPKKEQASAALPFWRRPFQIQTTTIAFLLISGVLAGWLVSELQTPQIPDLDKLLASQTAAVVPVSPDKAEVLDSSFAAYDPGDLKPGWAVQTDTSEFSENIGESAVSGVVGSTAAVDDAPALDLENDAELLALLGEDPDALAGELNKIEPSVAQSNETPDIIRKAPVVAEEPPVLSPAFLDKKPQAESVSTTSKITEFMKPDPALSDVIREVETQALKGSPEAQHDLAAIYTAGHGGVAQDYERASFWFRKAADQGIANAAYNLGVLYHQGLGVKPNLEEAIYWYGRAANLGHPEAQYNLGIAYIEGIGVVYDPVKAALYFENAADSGIMEAAYNLGLIYENGLLGQAKPDEALMWYKTASDRGSPEAKAALEQLAKSLDIKLEDVNRLAETMRAAKEAKAVPSVTDTQKTELKSPADNKQSELLLNAPDSSEAIASPVPLSGDSQALIAQIQDHLMSLGLYPGPANGVAGPLTGDAIRSYQDLNGLKVDGQPKDELLQHMLSSVETAGGDVGSRDE